MDEQANHIVWHRATVTRRRRESQNQHKSAILWFTGLSGSGKSTLAHAVEERLHQMAYKTFVLDGDNIRHGLCSDLGFSEAARKENIRRIAEVAKLMLDAGIITLTAFISPFAADRNEARNRVAPEDFLEIYCECHIAICEQRDVKGLYKRAKLGEINNFTGISSPYEIPTHPELTINTGECSLETSVNKVLALMAARGLIN